MNTQMKEVSDWEASIQLLGNYGESRCQGLITQVRVY